MFVYLEAELRNFHYTDELKWCIISYSNLKKNKHLQDLGLTILHAQDKPQQWFVLKTMCGSFSF